MEKENIEETITNILINLKELRTSNSLSMEALAEGIGVSRQVYDRIEKGLTELTISRIKQLADFYGIGMHEVIGCKDKDIVLAKTASIKKQLESYKDKLLTSQQEVIKLQREQTYKGL